MEISLKKVLAIILVTALAALSGCGAAGTQSSGAAAAQDSGGASSSGSASAPASDQQSSGEIRLMVNDGFLDNSLFNDGLAKFESESGKKVIVNTVQWDLGSSEYAISFAAGNAPDVIQLGDWSIRGDILGNRLYPLNEFIPENDINESNQGFVERFSNDGNLYAYMANTDVRLIFYNKAIFEEAGLDREKFPETWTEFKDMMGKVNHVRGNDQYAYGFIGTTTGVHTTIMWETLVRSLGGYAIDPDTGKILFGSPATVKAAEFYKELLDLGLSSKGVLGYDDTTMINEFASGNLACMMTGSWVHKVIAETGFNMDDLGYAYIPRADDGIFATIGGVWGLCISAACEDPATAWQLIKNLYTDEYFIDTIVKDGAVPTREKFMSYAEGDPFLTWIAQYSLDHGQAELHSQYFIEDIEALNIALNSGISGSADIQSTFDQVSKELNEKHGIS